MIESVNRSFRVELGRTLRLAVPVMISRVGILIMIAVDTAMSGHAGPEEIGYYGIGASLLVPLIVLSIGMLTATMVMTAQADGAGRTGECGSIYWVGLIHAVFLGFVAIVICQFAAPLLALFGQSEAMVANASRVVVAFGWGMPALLVYTTTSFFFEAIHRPLVGTVAMILANILNVCLNYFFVFGNAGIPALGAEGAAIATTLTRYALAIGMVAYLFFSLDRERFGLFRLSRSVWSLSRRFRSIGVPMALGTGLESTAFVTLALFAGRLGSSEAGAYTIAHNLNALSFMLALGLSTAAGIRTGNAHGRRDGVGILRAGWMASLAGAVLLGICAVLMFVFRENLTDLYVDDVTVAALTISVIPFMALALMPDGLQVIVIGALRGADDFWSGAVIQFVGFWLVMVPVAAYFSFVLKLGVPGLLLAVFIGAIVTIVISVLRFRYIVGARIRLFQSLDSS